MIKGIDVSDNNGKINWAAVKAAGVKFAILRIGYGNDDVSQDDKRFEENVAGCEANGIPWGAYIYSYAMSVNEAQSEVNHCLRRLRGKKPTYPIYFDMEDADGYKAARGGLSKELAVSICYTFLRTMESNGYYVGLYASLSWLNGKLNDSRLDKFDKWVAQWNTKCDYTGTYGMWQYGGSTNYIESPYVNGINGAVDKNYADYDFPEIIKSNGLNGWPKPVAEVPTVNNATPEPEKPAAQEKDEEPISEPTPEPTPAVEEPKQEPVTEPAPEPIQETPSEPVQSKPEKENVTTVTDTETKEDTNVKRINWKQKLTSRKMWLSIASFVSMLVLAFGGKQETATQVTSLVVAGASIIAYIAGEGFIDAARNSTGEKDEKDK